MFEWLDDEIIRINTRKFHLVDGPASAELRQAVHLSNFPLPPSYKEFVLRFGNAKLYRYSSNYYLAIFAGPREAETPQGEDYIQFGQSWTSCAYFKESLLVEDGESPIFESFNNCFRKTSEGFETWLRGKCASARRRFKKKEWAAIEAGPSPFTEHELAIVDARRRFRWRIVGVAPNDDVQFEICNESAMVLPYLSLGILGKLRPPHNGPLNGGIFLPVDLIRPGETKTIGHDCYKQFIAPEDTQAFDLPEPGPEDRDHYWEFKTLA